MMINPASILSKKSLDLRGQTAVTVAVMLVVLVGITALAVDVGFRMVTKNELQNIADAAALAAARQLGVIYESMTYQQQQAYVCDPSTILPIVTAVADQNEAGGLEGITINADDVTIGSWNSDTTPRLTQTNSRPNAVSVTVRMDGGTNGPITTFFARVFDINSMDVSADATAALTGESTAKPGDLELPIAISSQWFENFGDDFCNKTIMFYPTNTIEGCAGWNTFEDSPASASTLRNILDGMLSGSYESPEVIAGETQFEFIGGNVANALDDVKALFDAAVKDEQGRWETSVGVYSSTDCSNPSGTIDIVGFATVFVREVLAPPDGQSIVADVVCEAKSGGRGGGSNYGTVGTIPGLVE